MHSQDTLSPTSKTHWWCHYSSFSSAKVPTGAVTLASACAPGPHHRHRVSEVGQHSARQLFLCPQGDQGLESIEKGCKKLIVQHRLLKVEPGGLSVDKGLQQREDAQLFPSSGKRTKGNWFPGASSKEKKLLSSERW